MAVKSPLKCMPIGNIGQLVWPVITKNCQWNMGITEITSYCMLLNGTHISQTISNFLCFHLNCQYFKPLCHERNGFLAKANSLSFQAQCIKYRHILPLLDSIFMKCVTVCDRNIYLLICNKSMREQW